MKELSIRAVAVLVPMILSLTVHEYSHALAAKKLGDDTAEQMGRLTLNPLAHIDWVGTVILPLVLLIFGGGFFFGWAKPVPYNPLRFSRKVTARTGGMLVAAAGPASNLVLALLGAGVFSLALRLDGGAMLSEPAQAFLLSFILINIALFVFNMIPVYPLDGQKVVLGFLSGDAAIRFERFNMQFGSVLLLGVIFFGRHLIAVPFELVRRGVFTLVGLG
ncbi:MAG: site-2 protease family protein [Deltaproteobacteria bacterium]|nr:site-2 protease family protein [Deltaproteobacteria bacterium]